MTDILKALNLTGLENIANASFGAAAAGSANGSSVVNSAEHLDLQNLVDLPQNYSILINKLEQLALGLDSALGNFTIDRKEVEIALTNGASDVADDFLFGVGDPIAAGRAPPPHMAHGSHSFNSDDAEDFAHMVSDIWIGVILTLLIVFVIFFICACLLYHKFQQWKNSYRANRNDPIVEICRRCPPDYEVESLPSYTIVSGLPSYDDALEEFRKAGIILTPSVVPVIKIFESHEATAAAATKELYSIESTQPQLMGLSSGDGNADTISLHSTTCTCGGIGGGAMPTTITAVAPQLLGGCAGNHQQTVVNLNLPGGNGGIVGSQLTSQVIELSPEHLAALSQKRLSLQISFNNSVRRPSRSGATLRNNLLRSRAVGNTAGLGPIESSVGGGLTPIHRSTSTLSLTNERQLLDQRLRHLHHRGSLY